MGNGRKRGWEEGGVQGRWQTKLVSLSTSFFLFVPASLYSEIFDLSVDGEVRGPRAHPECVRSRRLLSLSPCSKRSGDSGRSLPLLDSSLLAVAPLGALDAVGEGLRSLFGAECGGSRGR